MKRAKSTASVNERPSLLEVLGIVQHVLTPQKVLISKYCHYTYVIEALMEV